MHFFWLNFVIQLVTGVELLRHNTNKIKTNVYIQKKNVSCTTLLKVSCVHFCTTRGHHPTLQCSDARALLSTGNKNLISRERQKNYIYMTLNCDEGFPELLALVLTRFFLKRKVKLCICSTIGY